MNIYFRFSNNTTQSAFGNTKTLIKSSLVSRPLALYVQDAVFCVQKNDHHATSRKRTQQEARQDDPQVKAVLKSMLEPFNKTWSHRQHGDLLKPYRLRSSKLQYQYHTPQSSAAVRQQLRSHQRSVFRCR